MREEEVILREAGHRGSNGIHETGKQSEDWLLGGRDHLER